MASTYLTKTFSSSPTNAKKGTVSLWFKLAEAVSGNTYHRIFATGADSSNRTDINIDASNGRLAFTAGGTNTTETNRLLRDQSAFYHLVISYDTTQATASDRVKFYINGVQETSFLTEAYPSQNADLDFGNNSYAHHIGNSPHFTPRFFHGIMSHFHYIDGTAYDADTFGETDATTGIWKPKFGPSVTYGTNGFFLKFENSGAFGTDSSGNGNNFTVNGTMTQTIDTPSNVFATLNPLVGLGSLTLSNGNLTCGNTTTAWDTISSTIGASSGKWYSEYKWDSTSGGFIMNGIISIDTTIDNINSDFYIGQFSTGYGYYSDNGSSYNNGSASAYGNSYTVGDIIGIAMDLDNSKLYFSKNGTWQNSGDPTSGATGTGAISITSGLTYAFGASNRNSAVQSINYGNGYFGTTAVSSAENPDDGIGIFEYDVPTGYRALCTKSINAEEYD